MGVWRDAERIVTLHGSKGKREVARGRSVFRSFMVLSVSLLNVFKKNLIDKKQPKLQTKQTKNGVNNISKT